ncbi:MAG: AraC family transcriptional regulator [Bacteroidota bacterium]
MPQSLQSRIAIHRIKDAMLLEGRVVDNATHAHHAMQVTWAVGEPARLSLDEPLTGGIVVIEGGVRHALRLERGVVCLLEPQGEVAQGIRQRWLRGEASVVRERPVESCDPEELFASLSHHAAPRKGDPRVTHVLDWLDQLEEQGRWREAELSSAARRVHLSASRFRHLFAERVGSSWRSYIRWRRALVATKLALEGKGLTQAAHAAGYADSAHLSRQFKELFGFTPSSAVGFSRFVQG